MCWRDGRRPAFSRHGTEAAARLCALCVSLVLPAGKAVRVTDPAGRTVETLRWPRRGAVEARG